MLCEAGICVAARTCQLLVLTIQTGLREPGFFWGCPTAYTANAPQSRRVVIRDRVVENIPIQIDSTGFPYGIPAQPSPQSRIIRPVVGEVETTSGMVEHAGIAHRGLDGTLASGQGFWWGEGAMV